MTAIFQIIAAIAGVSATIWINAIIKQYIQRYEDAKQSNKTKEELDSLEKELIRRDKDAKRLKEIEDSFSDR